MKPLDRPICSIDVESTGTDPAKDRIIQLGIVKILPNVIGSPFTYTQLFNPGVPIPPSSTAIHGFNDEVVKGMPKFASEAKRILEVIGGCDLLGFNIHNFDLPILWEEFHRAGINWVIDVNVIDAGTIFKKMQPRTLEAAIKQYVYGHEYKAHDALSDAIATWKVFQGQRTQHADLAAMTPTEIAKFSQFDDRIDLAGKLVMTDGKMHLRMICDKIIAEKREIQAQKRAARQKRLSDEQPF